VGSDTSSPAGSDTPRLRLRLRVPAGNFLLLLDQRAGLAVEAGEAVCAGGAGDGVLGADGGAVAGLEEGGEAEGEEEAVGRALGGGEGG